MEQEIIVEKENLEQEIELEKENIMLGVFPEGTLDVDKNGTYNVTDYASVDVNTPGIIPSGTINIIENGTHDVTNYANANVNVPGIVPTGVININNNGTYNVTEYEEANVQTSGVDINEYFDTTIDSNSYRAKNYLQKIPNFVITSDVTSLSQVFQNMNVSKEIIITGDVSNVTSVLNMFAGTTNAPTITLKDLDFSNITSLANMFYIQRINTFYCSTINLGIATSNKLTNIDNMFYNNNHVTQIIGLENINVTNCTQFSYLFYNDYDFTSLDLSSWYPPEYIRGTSGMFAGCSKLMFLDIRNFEFSKAFGNTGNEFGNVPAGCEIIVKNNTEKQWFATNWSNLTNVKTVEEYEGA